MVFPGTPTPFPMVAPKTSAQIEADMQLANSLHHAWMDYVHPPLTAAGDMLYGGGIGNWLYDLTHPTPFLEAENIESPDSISDFNSNHDVETGGSCPNDPDEEGKNESRPPNSEKTLTKSQQKSINSYQKRISEHQKKLSDYKENPEAFDNKGFLKKCT